MGWFNHQRTYMYLSSFWFNGFEGPFLILTLWKPRIRLMLDGFPRFLYSDSGFIVGTEIQVNSSWSKRIPQNKPDGEIGPDTKKQGVWTNGLRRFWQSTSVFFTKHTSVQNLLESSGRFWVWFHQPVSWCFARHCWGKMKRIIVQPTKRRQQMIPKERNTTDMWKIIHMAIVATSSLGWSSFFSGSTG